VPLHFNQPTQPVQDGRICNVPAIPRQQCIHFVNSSQCNMRGITATELAEIKFSLADSE
jgi:hypothetical protein